MKRFVNLSSIVFSLVIMATLMLTACGGKKTPASPTAAAKLDFSRHETFTVWTRAYANDYYSDDTENPAIQYLNRKFNVTLKSEQPTAGTEADSLSLMFGTGEYTNMVET
jgi:ABC-type glycerol-3-phosphate transport system substrate-binding protein